MTALKFQLENKSKLGKIAHFSTLPYKTCFQNCDYCYAVKSVRMYPSVKANYTTNTNALNNGMLLPDIPKSRNVVRMYVSGDFQNIHTIKQWILLAKKNPTKMLYGYTKQWKNPELLPYLTELKNLKNVVLRASVDSKTGYDIPATWSKTGLLEDTIKDKEFITCDCDKTCLDCGICFDKSKENLEVYFPKH